MKRKTEMYVVYVMRGNNEYPSMRIFPTDQEFPQKRILGLNGKGEETCLERINMKILSMSPIVQRWLLEGGQVKSLRKGSRIIIDGLEITNEEARKILKKMIPESLKRKLYKKIAIGDFGRIQY